MTNLTFRNKNRVPSLFDVFFDRPHRGSVFDSFLEPDHARPQSSISPQIYVDTKDEAYDISIAVPGIPKDTIEASVKENVLTVTHEQKEEKENNYFCSSFKKSWTLPKDVSIEQITAKYDNGIFNVSVPRVQPVEPEVKKIKIDYLS